MVSKSYLLNTDAIILVAIGMMSYMLVGSDRAADKTNTDICKDGVVYYRFIEHGDSVAPAFNKDGSLKLCQAGHDSH